MAWFSPLKGAFPSLQQIDKTLSVDSAQQVDTDKIVRGSLVYVTAGNAFKLAGDDQKTDPTALIYFALQGQDDFQAGMAGSIGQGPDGVWDGTFDEYGLGNIVAGAARITALACTMPLEFQTDQFDADTITGQTPIGTMLTCGEGTCAGVANKGGLLVAQASGENVCGQLTAAPFERWVNDAVAVVGRRTGAMATVINVRTLWLPLLVTAS